MGELVRGTVEETLKSLPDAEADGLCGAQRYQRTSDRTDYRAGSYDRTLRTKAGGRCLSCESRHLRRPLIVRYRRLESSIEESQIETYLAG